MGPSIPLTGQCETASECNVRLHTSTEFLVVRILERRRAQSQTKSCQITLPVALSLCFSPLTLA